MKTIQLYRPVGLKEMELIAELQFKEFPPRLAWQPIFYPVLNQTYAAQIAKEWNTTDENSGYCGIVTRFEIDQNYISKFPIQNVGGDMHNELWIPSEQLHEFNSHIVGDIQMIELFIGEQFIPSSNINLQKMIQNLIQ